MLGSSPDFTLWLNAADAVSFHLMIYAENQRLAFSLPRSIGG